VSGVYPQIIPRPERWEPGDPAPWSHLDPVARAGLNLERVTAALAERGLLGIPDLSEAVALRAIGVVDGDPVDGPFRHSSVLLVLFEEDGEARIVFTRRAAHLRTHRGEVSFPGGRQDDGEDAVAAALREAHEEVALDPTLPEVVGHLEPIATLVSGALIQPVVAVLAERPVLVPAPEEVERVFDVALAELLADGVFHEERWYRPDLAPPGQDSFPLWFFEVSGEMIWGATGRLLVDLLTIVLGLEDAAPH